MRDHVADWPAGLHFDRGISFGCLGYLKGVFLLYLKMADSSMPSEEQAKENKPILRSEYFCTYNKSPLFKP